MDEAGPGFEVHVEGLWGVSGARRVEDWEKGEGGEKEIYRGGIGGGCMVGSGVCFVTR